MRKTFLFLLLTVFSFNPLSFTFATTANFKPLYKLYNIKEVKTHYVIVVDTSLSMKPVFPTVRENLLKFSSSLNSQDTLTFITFANQPQKIYVVSLKRKRLKRAYRKLQTQKELTQILGLLLGKQLLVLSLNKSLMF